MTTASLDDRWWERAACVGQDPDQFFPPRGRCVEVVAAARAVCAPCPVRLECLTEGLLTDAHTKDGGIRAGLTATERDRLRSGRPRPDGWAATLAAQVLAGAVAVPSRKRAPRRAALR